MNETARGQGIGPDVATAVLKSMGVAEIDWTVTPFGSLIPGLKAKRFDFVAAEQNISPDRCKQVTFTEPNSCYGEGLLVKAGNPKKLHAYADIAKDPSLKVAIVSGADKIDFLHAVGVPDSQIVLHPGQCRRALHRPDGRADAYAATELTVAKLAKGGRASVEQAQPFTDPVVNGKPVRYLWRLRLPARGQGAARRLQQGAGRVPQDGRLQEDPDDLRPQRGEHRGRARPRRSPTSAPASERCVAS